MYIVPTPYVGVAWAIPYQLGNRDIRHTGRGAVAEQLAGAADPQAHPQHTGCELPEHTGRGDDPAALCC